MMKNSETKSEHQIELFARIRKMLPAYQALADVIGDLFGISEDAVYRRIRGTKLMDIEETIKLCQYFGISLDSVVGVTGDEKFVCTYAPRHLRNIEEYVNFAQSFSAEIERLRGMPEIEILLSAADIPVFNFLSYREMTLFYTFSWYKNLCGFSAGYDEFLQQIDVEQLAKNCKKVVNNYLFIPSCEIWTTHTIDSTMRLITYHTEMEHFRDNTIPLLLCEQLSDMMDQMQTWTEKGTKGENESPFKFYVSEIDIGNTFILFKNAAFTSCMVKLFMINGLSVSSEHFCNETEHWLSNLIKRSTPISGTSEKERHKFFSTQQQKIKQLRNELNLK